jgi:hypothetical protein
MLEIVTHMQRARIPVVLFQTLTRRNMSSTPDALVLLVPPKEFPVAPNQFQSSLNARALWSSTRAKSDKALETRLFHQETGPTLSFVALGKEEPNENARREAARKAVATGVKAARDAGARTIGIVSDKISAHDAGKQCFLAPARADVLTLLSAVASKLALFKFTLQTKEEDPIPSVEFVSQPSHSESKVDWHSGSLYAEGQNLAREVCRVTPEKYIYLHRHSLWK